MSAFHSASHSGSVTVDVVAKFVNQEPAFNSDRDFAGQQHESASAIRSVVSPSAVELAVPLRVTNNFHPVLSGEVKCVLQRGSVTN